MGLRLMFEVQTGSLQEDYSNQTDLTSADMTDISTHGKQVGTRIGEKKCTPFLLVYLRYYVSMYVHLCITCIHQHKDKHIHIQSHTYCMYTHT